MNRTDLTRRRFNQSIIGGALAFASRPVFADERFEAYVPCRAVTKEPGSHWFGYYDKLQFDQANRRLLGMQVGFNDREPRPDDAIELGYVDLEDNDRWVPFAETDAWCWQQGCMLQWLPGAANTVLYNIREPQEREGFHCVEHDIHSGAKRSFTVPLYAVSPKADSYVGTNLSRLAETRPGYGYVGPPDPFRNEPHPTVDGIRRFDMDTGYWKLIITLDRIANYQPDETMQGAKHWFNHLLYSPDGSRFIFLHRWERTIAGRRSWFTRMFTANPDGGDLHCVADHGMVSHFIWKNPTQILAWSREPESGDRFHLYTDQADDVEVIGDGVLTRDGHCTYTPDGEWILVDTYPDGERMQNLMLYRPEDGELVKLGRFYLDPAFKGQTRCDLHPGFSRDGRQVCIDSLHSGKRQMYVLDVSGITGA